MRKHSMPESKEANVNVTPLIDIVMCLIIFYMLVARIGVAQGVDPSVKVPDARIVGVTIDDPGNTIVLNVKMQANAPVVTLQKDKTSAELATVTNMDDLVKILKNARGKNEDFKAVIRGGGEMQYQYIAPVLLAVSAAKLKDYRVEATMPK